MEENLFNKLLKSPIRVPLVEVVKIVLPSEKKERFNRFIESYRENIVESKYSYDKSAFLVIETFAVMDYLKQQGYHRVTYGGLEALLNSTHSTVKPVIDELSNPSLPPYIKRPFIERDTIKINGRRLKAFYLKRNAYLHFEGLKKIQSFRDLVAVIEDIFPLVQKFALDPENIETKVKKAFHVPYQNKKSRISDVHGAINIEVFRKYLVKSGVLPKCIGYVWTLPKYSSYVISPIGEQGGARQIGEVYASKENVAILIGKKLNLICKLDTNPQKYDLNYSLWERANVAKKITNTLRQSDNLSNLKKIFNCELFPFYSYGNIKGIKNKDNQIFFNKWNYAHIYLMKGSWKLINPGFISANFLFKKI